MRPAIDIESIPHVSVRKWVEAHRERFSAIDFGDYGGDKPGYDILLAPGWCTPYDYGLHVAFERSAKSALAMFKSMRPCECERCKVQS